ncbi:glycosyltransferase family 4 protein [Chamaesiphon sp. VAR_48_metabat_135_sub]|uniref:glycosyltransferase family 4 protein n=1 Tax=Chamaesiphon sp. VAR_48_metabat_135_sub TaxID=2964699 RepID=UPI00286C9289|nr:glycosyltransferase family 4 protein [Chamaesiphon sp. VAR_48_metabat_135_sub]
MNNSFLIVASDFVKTGGMDRANYGLAEYIAHQGNNLHLVAYRVDDALAEIPNVSVHYVPKPLNSYSLGAPLLGIKALALAQRLSNQGNLRVIVNGGNCPWADINWVHYVHAADRTENKSSLVARLKKQLDRQIALRTEKIALQRSRIAIANSVLTQKHLIGLLDLEPSKTQTIYYGIDPTVFYPAKMAERQSLRLEYGWDINRPIVTFIGALGDRRKGFDSVFSAWQQLCQDPQWDAQLVVIGVGSELPLWEQRTQAAGLVDRIEFLGFRSDVPQILRAADCLVAPTRYEAYGLGVHEALCCGLPAITSATAGVAERYSAELQDLLLPDPNNVPDLVDRLTQWHHQQEYYRSPAIALSESLRRYTWDDMAREIFNIIA